MLNKLYKILFLINLLLVTVMHQAYAAPPALPPSLPNVEAETKSEHKKADSESKDSIFDKFKQFFSKSTKKIVAPQTKIKQEDDTKDKEGYKLATQESVENEEEANMSFMDIGSATLPSAANNELHNADESNTNLASHSDNDLRSPQTSVEATKSFMDVGDATLPSAANNELHNADESNTNLASHSDNDLHSPQTAVEATKSFMDVGNTTLPSATNNELHNDETPSEVHGSNPTNENSTNLAFSNLPVTPNVPNPLVTMPPLRPGSYVVPPSPPVQVYKPVKLPEVHKPVPLNHPVDVSEPSNQVPQTIPVPVASSVPNMPPMPVPVVNTPVAPNTTPNNLPPEGRPAANPALVPATPNMPPMPVPVVNTPVAPNTTPNNLPPVVPANQPVPSVAPISTPIVPSTPNVPSVVPMPVTTDSSKEINNSKQTVIASKDSEAQQGWDATLKPVEVLSDNQSDAQNDSQNQSANNIQNIVPIPQVQQPINVPIKKQDNKEDTKVTELSEKFAKDETQMLLLPNDDVVLGKLTKETKLEQMDIYSYIKLAQQKEEWIENADRRKAVENFIKYDNDLGKKKNIYATLSYCSAVDNAFRAIDKNNLSKLRVLLDIYPILQEKRKGDNLLTAAVYNDNYYLAKYLLIRGIKISTLNSECQYPLDIALANGNSNIACMLTKAKGYN